MVKRATIVAALLAAADAGGLARAEDRDPMAVLKRVSAKVLQEGNRMPNYTCVETVERRSYHPLAATLPRACPVILQQLQHPTLDLKPQLFSTDRLRLDVTMAGRGEIFSWAGASKFDEAGIEDLVREGPMGTGAFGAYLLAVFPWDSGTEFAFSRNVTQGGRNLMEFTYRVPAAGSRYKIRTADGSWFYTGFSGAFLVDPEMDEVEQLRVQTDELPESTHCCVSVSTMDFKTLPIGLSEVRLATHLLQRWIAPNGTEAENTTTFTSCREYTGESTVTFLPDGATPVAGSAAGAQPVTAPSIPAGLRFALTLAAPIDTATAAAGDQFKATLADALRETKNQVLAPKGSIVEGRILRIEVLEKPPQALVVLRPRTVEVKGVKLRLAASLDWQSAVIANRQALRTRVQLYLPQPGEEQSGVFRSMGKHVVLPKGMRSEWRSLAVDAPAGK